jgi:hypothetical protein
VLRILIRPQTLLQIGLGGYLIGRSVEKIVPGLMKKRQAEEEIDSISNRTILGDFYN